jgi:hypothetical protein
MEPAQCFAKEIARRQDVKSVRLEEWAVLSVKEVK